MITRRWLITLSLVAGVLGCGGDDDDPTGPDTRPDEALNFLEPAPDAPPLVSSTATLVAVRGEDAELRLEYQPRGGDDSGEDFLRFRVRANTLLAHPDGTPIAEGEAVTITVNVVDASRMIVEFQPSGLRFNPDEPAELRMFYSHADDDLNDDGRVDDDDEDTERLLSLWRRETAGQPWERIGSVVVEDLEEVRGELVGFTHYAIAY